MLQDSWEEAGFLPNLSGPPSLHLLRSSGRLSHFDFVNFSSKNFNPLGTQVVDLVLKYTASGSSMAFDRVRDPMLKYPDVFLCPRPGFKVEEMSKLSDISENPWLAPLTLIGTDKVRSHAEIFMTQNYLWFLSLKETLPIWQSAPANASQLLNWYWLKSTFQPKENVVFLDFEAKITGFVSYMYGQCTKIMIPMVN